MNKQQHIIKKQIIELNLTSQQGAFEVQNEVSRIYRSQVIFIIDNWLSNFSDSDTIYRVNTLEINLGNIDINDLEQQFIDKVIEQTQQPLSEKINLSSSGYLTKTEPNIEILSYFIQTGTLPWWSRKLSKQELEEYCDRLLTTSPKQVKYIVEQSLKNEIQLQRLIYQFSDATLLKITKLFTGDSSQFITDYYSIIKASFEQLETSINIPKTKFRLETWQGIFFSLCSQDNHTLADKIRLIQENLKAKGMQFKIPLTERLEQFINDYEDKLKINIQPEAKSKQLELNSIVPFSDSEEIYISNGGLILLWPFLTRLFSNIKLVEENCFVNLVAAERATLLLQYLVDGSLDSSEDILSLNKILCGIDLLEPMETKLDLTEQEQSECENLLSAVIQNWSILKNTSIEGFRKAFLQRNSILKVRDGEWLLQVERESYDILLDRIPWSIRVVKLPWMDKILYVEW